MAVKFIIEKVLPISEHGQYILARPLTHGQEFRVTDKSFLGGVLLEEYLDIPRIAKDNGKPDLDVYSFRVKIPDDIRKLTENSIVDLVPGHMFEVMEPWYFTDKNLVAQLEKEINMNHILYGLRLKTIARRQDNDDVLFEVTDKADFKYAKVHLTWASKHLQDSEFPSTKTFSNWQDVYEKLVIPDNKNWE